MLSKMDLLRAKVIVVSYGEDIQKSEHFNGLDKIMSDWKHIKGVHKPATGQEEQGVSDTGVKVREAHAAHQQGAKMQAQHAEQKAHIRHDDVIAQQKDMKVKEQPKATAADYAAQAAPKVAGIQSKWGKVKEQLK